MEGIQPSWGPVVTGEHSIGKQDRGSLATPWQVQAGR